MGSPHHTYPDQNTSLCSPTRQKWGCSANPRAYRSTAQRRSLTQNPHKIFDFLAKLAQGLALSMEWIVIDVITGRKHEKNGERALSK